MAADFHIICGPEGSGKTRRLLDRFQSITQQGIGVALWIGPNERYLDTIRSALAKQAAVLSPHLVTFHDFAGEIIRCSDVSALPLPDSQRRLLTDDLLNELADRGELSHFDGVVDTRGFSEGVFALLAELKRNEIWPAQLARAGYLPHQRIEEAARRIGPRAIRPKQRQLARLYARYQQHLIRENRYDLEGRFWYARDLLAQGRRRPFENVRCVLVDGFTHFTRTQREALQALAKWVQEIWVTMPDDLETDRLELFSRSRAGLNLLQDQCSKIEYLQPSNANNPLPPGGGGSGRGGCTGTPSSPSHRFPIKKSSIPAGLAHVERQLFRPVRSIQQSDDAEGLLLIQAPGVLGEARLVARHIKSLLLNDVHPAEVVVTMRDLDEYADSVREVFSEYGIPIDVEGNDPWQRRPVVAMLLRAQRLPEEDWHFRGVTALLRSGFLQPDWPEVLENPGLPLHAEMLLRLLGEPRGRAAYLAVTERWINDPPPLLEGEEGEQRRWEQTQVLARLCLPFLQKFFQAWDDAPAKAPLADHLHWLQRLANELGLGHREDDRILLDRFFDELFRWCDLEKRISGGRIRNRHQFARLLTVAAAGAGPARTPRGPGRVRVLSADTARSIKTPYLFIMGLGERSFPDLSAPEPILDEGERQEFRQAGLDFPPISDRLSDEMLLFYQLVAGTYRRLVLSYPAVDNRGQEMLPSSFLSSLLDCFQPGAVETVRRQLLIEGWGRDAPLSPAEYRVAQAKYGNSSSHTCGESPSPLSPDAEENLAAARLMAKCRLQHAQFTAFDGQLRYQAVLADLQKLFGPQRIFSPTSFENYIACPFAFFCKHVLRLQPLEEPTEQVEQTRRGVAFHRALARLHRQFKDDGIHEPNEETDGQLIRQLDEAVGEHIERAESPAARELWRLEGIRLQRIANRYAAQWEKFVGPWNENSVAPRPHLFEWDFGVKGGAEALTLRIDDISIRIGGRIDRVDLAELPEGLGFWIIDYKTGQAAHYTRAAFEQLELLQLPLYALAVQEVALQGQPARPLGLAYWMVTGAGFKPMLPSKPILWLEDQEAWQRLRDQLLQWVKTLVGHISQGDFPLRPRSEHSCHHCPYGQVCRIAQSRSVVEKKDWQLT